MAEKSAPSGPAADQDSGTGANKGFDFEGFRKNAQEFLRDKEAVEGLTAIMVEVGSFALKWDKQRGRRDLDFEKGRAKAALWIGVGVCAVFLVAVGASAWLVYIGKLGSDAFAFLLGSLTGALATFAAERVLPMFAPSDNGEDSEL